MTTPQPLIALIIKRLLLSLFILLTISLPFVSKAQKASNWYFGGTTCWGGGVRLDFTSGSAVLSSVNHPLKTLEGSSAISDASGTPLFFTDGQSIWDASTLVSFGTGLGGDQSTTQSAIVVEKPGSSPQQWLVFTKGVETGALRYYTVSGTLGSFTISGATTLVAAGIIGEGLTIVGSTNPAYAYWVVTRNVADEQLRTFSISTTGVLGAANLSSITYSDASPSTSLKNQLTIKSNTCQNKLALSYLNSIVDVVDFDAATGKVVANSAKLLTVASAGGNSGSYGIEFSANDNFLYITNLNGKNLYRYNVVTGVGPTLMTTLSGSRDAGQLALGPDNKIYMAIAGVGGAAMNPSYLGVIDDPGSASSTLNETGITISTVVDGLGQNACLGWGLPTFPKALISSTLEVYPGDNTYCINTSIPLSFLFGGSINASTISWTVTGGGQTFTPGGASSTDASPSVTFSTTGAKVVTLTFNDNCGRPHTKSMTLTIVNVSTTTGTISCSPPSSIILTSPNANAVWYDAASGGNILGIGSPVTLNYGSDATAPSSVWVDVAASAPSSASTGTNVTVGPAPSWLNGSSYVYSTKFNVLSDHGKLNSFQLEPRGWPTACPAFISLSFTIEIRNAANTLIYSLPYTAPANTFSCDNPITIPVGADLLRGNGYTISLASFSSNASAWYQIFNGFPVTVANVATNTGPTSNYTIMGNLKFTSNNYTVATGCSSRTLVTKACTLPVEWVSVIAKRTGSHSALVTWAVAMELNNERFDIQRSLDGVNFSTIGTVKGRVTSSSYKEYSFTDLSVPFGVNVYYRVVQVDIDGKSSASSIVVVAPEGDPTNIISIYPNPSAHVFNIEWYSEINAQYQVFDVRGVVVASGSLKASNGIETVGENFTSGVYIVKVFAANETYNLKLIKQ